MTSNVLRGGAEGLSEDELAQLLSGARGEVAFFEVVGERVGIGGVADGQAGISDFFYQEFQPPEGAIASAVLGGETPAEEIRNQLF